MPTREVAMPNPNERDEAAVERATWRLHAAVAALWAAGATAQKIEDEVEEAMIEAGVDGDGEPPAA
jgi:hypothetical protein